MTDDNLQDILNKEIARELMREFNSNVKDSDVDIIYEKCDNNPWNAGILYLMMLESGRMSK